MFIARWLKQQDIFGHPVSLNFGKSKQKDEDGSDSYQTYLGAILSLLVKGLFILCILYFALRMFYYADNNNNQMN